jgi:hypothetical protein
MSAFNDWFEDLSPEEQERLHDIARRSILQLPRCPRDFAILQELLAWQQLEINVLESHADWLARTKARFERRGIKWTVENLNRLSRLGEVE